MNKLQNDKRILIHGKGSKERKIVLCNDDVVIALQNIKQRFIMK